MRRLKLSFLLFSFILSLGFATSGADAAPGTGGAPATGGAPGVGGAAAVRRHVGTIVQGTSYLTYVSYLCLALVGFGIIGMQVNKTKSERKKS